MAGAGTLHRIDTTDIRVKPRRSRPTRLVGSLQMKSCKANMMPSRIVMRRPLFFQNRTKEKL